MRKTGSNDYIHEDLFLKKKLIITERKRRKNWTRYISIKKSYNETKQKNSQGNQTVVKVIF